MKSYQIKDLSLPYELRALRPQNLQVDSQILRGNPLADPASRQSYFLVPQDESGPLPLVVHLCGYFSTSYDGFVPKTLQSNFVQKLDEKTHNKSIPPAIHFFLEANTFWGGSQFINSEGCGLYRDYFFNEVLVAIEENFNDGIVWEQSWLMGGSSGGYGALTLIADPASPFVNALAVAPDSFFELSLLPEIYQAAPELQKWKSWQSLRLAIQKGEIQEKKSFFNLMNVIAMAHCYSPREAFHGDFMDFPIDLKSGKLNVELWQQWKSHDPLEFLKHKKQFLKNKYIHLDVGLYDQYHLQFGARQVYELLKQLGVKSNLTEYSGNHFGLSQRRLDFLETLKGES